MKTQRTILRATKRICWLLVMSIVLLADAIPKNAQAAVSSYSSTENKKDFTKNMRFKNKKYNSTDLEEFAATAPKD